MSKKHRHGGRRANHRGGQAGKPGRIVARGYSGGRRSGLVTAVLLVISVVLVFAIKGRNPNAANQSNNAPTAHTPASAAVPSIPAPDGPRIQFASRTYNFGKIEGDQSIDSTFVFTNVGTALLELAQVNPSCSCMRVTEWNRQVPPGQSGRIVVNYNSRLFTGHFGKHLNVLCNDALETNITLQVTGDVWRPLEISPPTAVLNVNPETPSNATTVKILSNMESPFLLTNLQNTLKSVAVELQTNRPGKEYQLIIKTLPPFPTNNLQDVIQLRSSSTNMPLVEVKTWINHQPLLQCIPGLLRLPAAPLSAPYSPTVYVRNNGTNKVSLSEASVNATDVEVRIKEELAGVQYSVLVKFPAGFNPPPNDKLELSLKTTHPQYSILKVPILPGTISR